MVTVASGCDTYEQQNEFTERAFGEQPEDYTPTDIDGNVDSTSIDDDDWRTAPAYSGVIVKPAHPNPLSEGVGRISITVPFLESVDGRIVLCAFAPNNSRFRTIDSLPETTGTQVLIIQPGHVRRTGLVRLFVMDSVTTECSAAREVISYGDVMIE